MHQIQPTVGQWYLRSETGQRFEVIDIDDGDGMIEIQDEEGTLDELDSDTWSTLGIELTQQPHDATLSFDNVAEPDEADGGDPVDLSAGDNEPFRVARDELLNDANEAITANDPLDRGDEGDEDNDHKWGRGEE
jgi:hypothetical protein